MRVAQSWIVSAVTAAKAAAPSVKPYLYDVEAVYDRGFQITSWPAAASGGLQVMFFRQIMLYACTFFWGFLGSKLFVLE